VENAFAIATLWFGLALIATFLASRFRISGALMEILIGISAAAVIGRYFGPEAMGADLPWLKFLASTGAVVLTFLAGAELEPAVMRRKWKEVALVGAASFFAPFLGCAGVARYVLGWSVAASWLGGIALSTTLMAVVYAVMLETGFNRTDYGKGILGACFVTDLGTVLALVWRREPRGVRAPSHRHPSADEPLRKPDGGLPHEMGALHSVRPGLLGVPPTAFRTS
jgi:Kef-type K+ transport system membrane component KefB